MTNQDNNHGLEAERNGESVCKRCGEDHAERDLINKAVNQILEKMSLYHATGAKYPEARLRAILHDTVSHHNDGPTPNSFCNEYDDCDHVDQILALFSATLKEKVRETNIKQIENWRDWIKHDKSQGWLVAEMNSAIDGLQDHTQTDENGVWLDAINQPPKLETNQSDLEAK